MLTKLRTNPPLASSPISDGAETTLNRLGALQTLGESLRHHIELDTLLDSAGETIFSELSCAEACVYLFDEKKTSLEVRASRGEGAPFAGARIALHEGLVGQVAAMGKPVLVETARADTAPVLCVPIMVRNEIRGAIWTKRQANTKAFSVKDLQMLQIMAGQLAAAIDNVLLMEGLRANNYAIVRSLAEAVEAKDPYTRGHCEYVARYSLEIAKHMGFAERELEEIKIGCILHDVGKIGIPEDILTKPEKLTRDEFEQMKSHPAQGAKIVEPLHLPQNSLDVIKYHHERLDGRGYPYGLVDEEIYLGAKIVMVADTFDAMTSNRPYRNGLSVETAVQELKRWIGSQFDPAVVEAFLDILPRLISEGVLRPHLCHPQYTSTDSVPFMGEDEI